MRPGVAADGVTALLDFADHFGVGDRHFADREERCLGAMGVQRGENRRRVRAQGAVVERQHDLARLEEVIELILLRSELRPVRGVDLDDTRNAQCPRLAGALACGGRGASVAGVCRYKSQSGQ